MMIFSALFFVSGCADKFDDDTMALLKKKEILSVVLEPPEAAPGEVVRASFLIADERGIIEDPIAVWLPDEPAELASEPFGAAFEMILGSEEAYRFDENGLSSQGIGLAVAIGDVSDEESMMKDIDERIKDGAVKMNTRTLVVSTRQAKNRNPTITSISGSIEGRKPATLAIVTSRDENTSDSRHVAADDPWLVEAGEEVTLHVAIEDDGNLDEDIRYQWISTGGDFGGERKKDQAWKAPIYVDPGEGEEDQSGMENVDPRIDPNLYPIWLVVRDNGADDQLGQSWAEFYVRVTPKQDSK